MKNKLATIIMGVMAVLTMGVATMVTPESAEVAAAVTCPAGSARDTAESYAQCNIDGDNKDDDGSGLWKTVNNIINVLLGLMGILAVAVIIYGGFQFATSSGDAGKVKTAKDTILYGVIGLIVAMLAFAIVNFVVASVFNNQGSSGSGNDNGSNSGKDSSYIESGEVA